jgi:malate synthase
MTKTLPNLKITGAFPTEYEKILSTEALTFISALHNKFESGRKKILQARTEKQKELAAGANPRLLSNSEEQKSRHWNVAPAPADLDDRRVEITGPVERKMMINAMNSGANVFMADLEDSLSPTWKNVVDGQINLFDTVRRTITLNGPEGKVYKLNDKVATLLVRPRGWHLDETHVSVDGAPVSASLFDFGIYFFHNAKEQIARGSGPYFYLPKLENHLEARLWNEVFVFAQDYIGIPQGTIRATVLLETILAAFEMDEILFELKDHASGLNAGRWDYIFSFIKKFSNRPELVLPDRAQVTMTVPFMKSYCDLIVRTCHNRKAHAMGGMAAFIPSRRDEEINRSAMAKVTEDKQREVGLGFDGTWVAHPDLVPIAKKVFDEALGTKPNQKEKLREDVKVTAEQLIDARIDNGAITEKGISNNVDVALQYINSWLEGVGAAAIHNLMEDAATAEISRAQLWQWIKNKAKLSDGRDMTAKLYSELVEKHVSELSAAKPGRFAEARKLLDDLVLSDEFIEFLTIPAYKYLQD